MNQTAIEDIYSSKNDTNGALPSRRTVKSRQLIGHSYSNFSKFPKDLIVKYSDCYGLDLNGQNGSGPDSPKITRSVLKSVFDHVTAISEEETVPVPPSIKAIRSLDASGDLRSFVKSAYTPDALSKIALFVNPLEKGWRASPLLIAFRFVCEIEMAIETARKEINSGKGRLLTHLTWDLLWKAIAAPGSELGNPSLNSPFAIDIITIYNIFDCLATEEERIITLAAASSSVKSPLHVIARAAVVRLMRSAPNSIVSSIPAQVSIAEAVVNSEKNNGSPLSNGCRTTSSSSAREFLAGVQTCVEELFPPLRSIVSSPVESRSALTRLLLPSSAEEAAALSGILYNFNAARIESPVLNFWKAYIDAASFGGAGKIFEHGKPIEEWFCPIPNERGSKNYFRFSPRNFDIRETWYPEFASLYTEEQTSYFAIKSGFTNVVSSHNFSKHGFMIGDESVATVSLSSFDNNGARGGSAAALEAAPSISDEEYRGIDETQVVSLINSSASSRQQSPSRDVRAYVSSQSALWHSMTHLFSVYDGIVPGTRHLVSPVSGETLDPFSTPNVITFGVCEFPATLESHTVSDVAATIETKKSFSVFYKGNSEFPLPTRVIHALTEICRRNNRNDESGDYDALLSAIETAKRFAHEFTEHAEKLLKSYNEADNLSQMGAINALQTLFYTGMYMRGWKVSNETRTTEDLPIEVSQTTFSEENQIEVDKNVTISIGQFDTHINSITHFGLRDSILTAPLLSLNKTRTQTVPPDASMAPVPAGEMGRYKPVNISADHGNTIGTRINIVKRGDSEDSIYSCMRVSSNVFVSTASYYLCVALRKESFLPIDVASTGLDVVM